ncbi:MAG: Septum formation initiator [Bacteroidetes bacterium ADurb.Bin408]|nr:MAG: Septum formation initiator [Bacteroidetes bacterium ADurb.Bin408]
MRKKIFNIIKNKYFIASLAFIVWVGFIDSDHNFFRQVKLKKDLMEMNKLKEYYQKQIEANKTLAQRLENDISFVEKYAREEYQMTKPNEIVYVLVP